MKRLDREQENSFINNKTLDQCFNPIKARDNLDRDTVIEALNYRSEEAPLKRLDREQEQEALVCAFEYLERESETAVERGGLKPPKEAIEFLLKAQLGFGPPLTNFRAIRIVESSVLLI